MDKDLDIKTDFIYHIGFNKNKFPFIWIWLYRYEYIFSSGKWFLISKKIIK